MFERYTEAARRGIFFARYEASCHGADSIAPEHLLLGLIRQDPLVIRLAGVEPRVDPRAIRDDVEGAISRPPPTPVSVDMPLAPSAKLVLDVAAEASDRLKDIHIGVEHLLLGLVSVRDTTAARVLNAKGITPDLVEAAIAKGRLATAEKPVGHGVTGGMIGGMAGGIPGTRQMPGQWAQLIGLLLRKGVITEEELAQFSQSRPSSPGLFDALVELLVRKGVITEDERQSLGRAD
ncbi:MAG TPA: Clp protease N-terminal domain-containing protein [Blastocatellia bacterium]|nr:Clp protease N-terminal domain-containing protein [Blastocatellia bacterium]